MNALIRIDMLRDVTDDGDCVGAGGEDRVRLLELDAADCDQWNFPDQFFPFADAFQPLRRKRHFLQRRFVDGSERYVVGLVTQLDFEFFVSVLYMLALVMSLYGIPFFGW